MIVFRRDRSRGSWIQTWERGRMAQIMFPHWSTHTRGSHTEDGREADYQTALSHRMRPMSLNLGYQA